ncbi:hypothetical protein QFC19_001231 [Naganishia cerealis]|uniref:Uncharacterized protein n=1 Tax=Naganishia cerealis TaxID=610337 RepID=A0ACC2WK62_9TREE|nr:hypothetical protein QFC19_001231 [Naganishia cerealis]
MPLALDYDSDGDEGDDARTSPARPPPALGLPPPKNKKRPLKIGFDHPLLSAPRPAAQPDGDERTAKKQRTADADDGAPPPPEMGKGKGKGKGKSTLLDMLPPPKRALPPSSRAPPPSSRAVQPPPTTEPPSPPPEEPAQLDLFGLAAPSVTVPLQTTTAAAAAAPTISSAPAITEYTPPIPTAQDPYPGYYPLPSGGWAAYDPTYYAQFFPPTTTASAQLVEQGAMGRGWSDVQTEQDNAVHVDVRKGLEQARKEQDELKRLTAPTLYAEENTYKVRTHPPTPRLVAPLTHIPLPLPATVRRKDPRKGRTTASALRPTQRRTCESPGARGKDCAE